MHASSLPSSTIDSWYSPSFPPRKHAARPRKKRMNCARGSDAWKGCVIYEFIFIERVWTLVRSSIIVYASMNCNLMAIYFAFFLLLLLSSSIDLVEKFLVYGSKSEKWIKTLLLLHEHKPYCSLSSNLCGERNRSRNGIYIIIFKNFWKQIEKVWYRNIERINLRLSLKYFI